MYKKLALATALSTALLPVAVRADTAAPAAEQSPHTLTANVSLVSDYRFRGISQTFKDPAIQGGIDYSHSSGFYLGTWASNVSSNPGNPTYPNGNNMEWDFYGGYKFAPAQDWTIDLGTLYYYYPGSWLANTGTVVGPSGATATHTGKTRMYNWEVYGAISWNWLSFKYSYALSDLFAVNSATTNGGCGVDSSFTAYTAANAPSGCFFENGGSKGSGYSDLTATYPLTEKVALVAHYGHQTVKNYGNLSYSDWKLGVTYDLGSGWSAGASYIDTNAKKEFYRQANAIPTGSATPDSVKETGDGALVLSIGRTF